MLCNDSNAALRLKSRLSLIFKGPPQKMHTTKFQAFSFNIVGLGARESPANVEVSQVRGIVDLSPAASHKILTVFSL